MSPFSSGVHPGNLSKNVGPPQYRLGPDYPIGEEVVHYYVILDSCAAGSEVEQPGGRCVAADQTYHAGLCPRILDGLDFRFGIVRHDDVVTYIQSGTSRIKEKKSGFYAADMNHALIAAALYLLPTRIVIYVQGVHERASSSYCDTPIQNVNEDRHDLVATRAATINWSWYHLLMRNCQHWARAVVR